MAAAFFALFTPFFLVPGMITLLFGELVPSGSRAISTEDFVYELRPKVAKLAAPGARSIMVSQKQMRGIRSLGRSEIEE